EEIADTLPAALGKWLLRTGWARRLVERLTKSGKVVKTTSITGFLLLYGVASRKRFRRGTLRFAEEMRSIEAGIATNRRLAPLHYHPPTQAAGGAPLRRGH